jgi:hypothetical protein
MTLLDAAPAQALPRAKAILSDTTLVRAGSGLLIAPNLLLAWGLRGLPAIVLAIGCALAFVLVAGLRADARSSLAAAVDKRLLATCGALSLGVLLLGGETHLFYANADWLMRDAVLSDLTRYGFPVAYRYEGEEYLLRAPLGMYLLPAALGQLAGLKAAHVALLAQNVTLLALCLYFVARLATARTEIVLSLFLLFSGLEIVPTLLISGSSFSDQIEWWFGYAQYSAHLTQLFWVPNHSLPGWWCAVLLLLFVRREIDLSVLIATFVATPLWSPLSAAGAAVLIAVVAALRARELISPRNMAAVVAGLCFVPAAVYLTIDAGTVKHFWIVGVEGFAVLYIAFIMIEIPHAGIVLACWSKIDARERSLVVASIAILLVLPFYSFGPNNDLAMRASIPALFLLAFFFARLVASMVAERQRLAIYAAVIVVVSLAAPLQEALRALFLPAYAISDCNFLSSWKRADPHHFPSNYLARRANVAPLLVEPNAPALEIEDRRCWPDHSLIGDR